MTRRRRWQLPDPAASAPAEDPALAVLADIAHALAQAEDAVEAYQYAVDRVAPAVGASLGAIFLRDGASELLRPVAAHAWPSRWRPWLGEMRIRLGVGPAGEAAAERRLIEVPDVLADPALEDWHEVAQELGFRGVVAVPVLGPRGAIGALTVYAGGPVATTGAQRLLLRAVADLVAAMHELDEVRRTRRLAEAALEDERSRPPLRTDDSEATA